jgi:hypothetical protein
MAAKALNNQNDCSPLVSYSDWPIDWVPLEFLLLLHIQVVLLLLPWRCSKPFTLCIDGVDPIADICSSRPSLVVN